MWTMRYSYLLILYLFVFMWKVEWQLRMHIHKNTHSVKGEMGRREQGREIRASSICWIDTRKVCNILGWTRVKLGRGDSTLKPPPAASSGLKAGRWLGGTCAGIRTSTLTQEVSILNGSLTPCATVPTTKWFLLKESFEENPCGVIFLSSGTFPVSCQKLLRKIATF